MYSNFTCTNNHNKIFASQIKGGEILKVGCEFIKDQYGDIDYSVEVGDKLSLYKGENNTISYMSKNYKADKLFGFCSKKIYRKQGWLANIIRKIAKKNYFKVREYDMKIEIVDTRQS